MFSRLNNDYGLIQSFSQHVKEGKLEVYLTKPFSYMMQMLFTFLVKVCSMPCPYSLSLL
ncbi:ABC-2 family transporter protein [Bartonella sp. B1098]|uniref:ABC-2 family transporter protein n=1 Tax=Bartonella sp. B1098 TaxID=2911421 RepID=UPI003531ACE6